MKTQEMLDIIARVMNRTISAYNGKKFSEMINTSNLPYLCVLYYDGLHFIAREKNEKT